MFAAALEDTGAQHILSGTGTPCEVATSNIFLYGQDAAYRGIAISPPNGLPMMKTLCSGEVDWLLIKLSPLVEAFKKESKQDGAQPVDNIQAILDYIAEFDAERLVALSNDGLVVQIAKQKAWQTIYIPVGWAFVEMSGSGILVYGVRKSFLPANKEACDEYALYTEMHRSAQSPSLKFVEGTLEAMQAAQQAKTDTEKKEPEKKPAGNPEENPEEKPEKPAENPEEKPEEKPKENPEKDGLDGTAAAGE